MSEPEKKGSPWPWILVPAGAVIMFFVLRECRQKLPPAPDHSPAAEIAAPAESAEPEPAPAPVPAPQ